MTRRSFMAGNWKMHLDRRGARDLATAVREHAGANPGCDVALFPAFVHLDEVARLVAGSPVMLGAQNCSHEQQGAHTGEVSALMLADLGVKLVLVGHSERRHVYGESDELSGKKVAAALEAGLDVVLCVGETLEQREAGETETVVARQTRAGLESVSAALFPRITIAYEPVWAIGTGRTASPAQAGEVHAYLRGVISGLYGPTEADAVRILYGGSVKPDNVRELMAVADVDGALVGGASLESDSFAAILDGGSAA